ncbi:MAG: hypothetical protein JWO13_367 [Acidobacteriales bacterium]|nr:hypothetical protein [Terriglobales bacterium]
MIGRPTKNEAAPYYFKYIDLVPGDDPVSILEQQYETAIATLTQVSEGFSLYRYADAKWSIRTVLNHVNDGERLFSFRMFWFARGFCDPLPSFEGPVAAKNAKSDLVPWSAHVEEFLHVRLATLSLVRNLPKLAWFTTGMASGNLFSVRALAYIIAGHLTHHLNVIQERYLPGSSSAVGMILSSGTSQ